MTKTLYPWNSRMVQHMKKISTKIHIDRKKEKQVIIISTVAEKAFDMFNTLSCKKHPTQ